MNTVNPLLTATFSCTKGGRLRESRLELKLLPLLNCPKLFLSGRTMINMRGEGGSKNKNEFPANRKLKKNPTLKIK